MTLSTLLYGVIGLLAGGGAGHLFIWLIGHGDRLDEDGNPSKSRKPIAWALLWLSMCLGLLAWSLFELPRVDNVISVVTFIFGFPSLGTSLDDIPL